MARGRTGRTGSSDPFPHLGPVGVDIPVPTGTVRLLRETDGGVLVEVNGVPSSYQHPDPQHLVFEYMRWMQSVLVEIDRAGGGTAWPSGAPEIAHLGGGGCSLPRAVAARWPGARQVVVELDAALAESARTWFDLPRSPALRIRAGDAGAALAAWREDRFDVIVRDVFAGDRTPDALRGREAAAHAARALRPGGTYLVNSAGSRALRAALGDEIVTLRSAFAHVGVIAEPGVLQGGRRGNCVLVASDASAPAGIDRALRSDPVSVRWCAPGEVDRLAASGRVLDAGA